MGDPGPGGMTTHRADEAQEPSPGERPVGDGSSSCSDRHSLRRVGVGEGQSGRGPQVINQQSRSQGTGGGARPSHCLMHARVRFLRGAVTHVPRRAGASPGQESVRLTRPCLGPHAQHGPQGPVWLLHPLVPVLPEPGPEEGHALGSPNTPKRQHTEYWVARAAPIHIRAAGCPDSELPSRAGTEEADPPPPTVPHGCARD